MIRAVVIGMAALSASACGGVVEGGAVSANSAERVVWAAARAAHDRMGKAGPAPFVVEVVLTDAYGNESAEPALGFAWAQSDLDRINRENISETQLIDLASVTILSRRGVIALAEWCSPEADAVTHRLCGAERARAEDLWVSRTGG